MHVDIKYKIYFILVWTYLIFTTNKFFKKKLHIYYTFSFCYISLIYFHVYVCMLYVCMWYVCYAHINMSQIIYIYIMALVMFSKSLIIINNRKYKSINVLKCSNIKENICE